MAPRDPDARARNLSYATGGASERSSKAGALAKMYRPPFEIISLLPFGEARDEGKKEEKWVMVNIQELNPSSTARCSTATCGRTPTSRAPSRPTSSSCSTTRSRGREQGCECPVPGEPARGRASIPAHWHHRPAHGRAAQVAAGIARAQAGRLPHVDLRIPRPVLAARRRPQPRRAPQAPRAAARRRCASVRGRHAAARHAEQSRGRQRR